MDKEQAMWDLIEDNVMGGNINQSVRAKTSHKYGKATKCARCGSKFKVEHHHNTVRYEVDEFKDLCKTCHRIEDSLRRIAKKSGLPIERIEALFEMALINRAFCWLFPKETRCYADEIDRNEI